LKELRIALVGGGFMGKAHSLAYALASDATELSVKLRKDTLVDITPELAADAARRLGWESSSASWEETIARPDIDIIDICTPPDQHEKIALAALAAGKHVFCEKPITNELSAATRMADAARESGCVTQVGFNYRHTPAISFAKKLLDDGRLGIPLQFRGRYLQDAAFTASPTRWRASPSTGGSGMVGDIGSHILDIAQHLFGDIVRVGALVRARATDGGGWIAEEDRIGKDVLDEAAVWIAQFANGAIGNFSINAYASGHKNDIGFSFDATKGSVEFGWNDRERFHVSYIDEPTDHLGFRSIFTNDSHPDGWWKLTGVGTGYIDIMAVQFQHFIKAIKDGGVAHPDFADGARVQAIVQAVRLSAESGTWVDLPVETAEAPV
jgi:predicted dehydrogenase